MITIKRTPIKSVFEISGVEFPDYYNIDTFRKQDTFSPVPPNDGRESSQSFFDEDSRLFIKNLADEIATKLKSMLKRSDVDSWWPMDYIEKYDMGLPDEPTKGVGHSFIIDSPKFDMGYHVDNGLSLMTWIINIKDNPNAHTVYADKLNYDWKETYRGPDKKGTGMLHINRHGLYHTGLNEGNEDRAVLIGYYEIKN